MSDPPDFYDDLDLDEPRRKRWLVPVAAFLALALLGTYALSELLQNEVIPRVQPGGSSDAFAFLAVAPGSGEPVRYNPCEPLHYVVAERHLVDGALEDVSEGVRLLGDAAGVEFVFDGVTTETPSRARPIYQPRRYGTDRWAPILLAWVPEDELLSRGRHAAGAGGSTAVANAAGVDVYVTGTVTFNADLDLPGGFGPGRTRGDVVLHEMGHVLGLAHVEDRLQIMFRNLTEGRARLGDGDRAGLRRLGRAAGCVPTPRPGRTGG